MDTPEKTLPKITRRFMVISTRVNKPGTAPDVQVRVVEATCLDPRPSPEVAWSDDEARGWLRMAAERGNSFGPHEHVVPLDTKSNRWETKPEDVRHVFVNKDGEVSVVYEIV